MAVFGVIRWDAWYADTGPALQVARSLAPAKWRSRAPFWATELSDVRLRWDATVSTMEQEIAYAAAADIDYFAFLRYPPTGSDAVMNNGLAFYQQAWNKAQVPWVSIESASRMTALGGYVAAVPSIVAEMGQAHYLKLTGNRPLWFLFDSGISVGGYVTMASAVTAMRTQAAAAGLGDPYVVLMHPNSAATAATSKTAIGADAATTYVGGVVAGADVPYATQATATEAFWETLRTAATTIVPICQMGWDRRPRVDRPMSWERTTQKPFFGHAQCVLQPTPSEAAAHVQAALDYMTAHPAACPLGVAIAYAWNEHDEGGWLCPTLGDPTGANLTAIAGVLP